MNRAIDLAQGRAMVITDLHGAWTPYARYRDYFLEQYHQGVIDYLIILGDVIHGYGSPTDDASLEIVLDIMTLRGELGSETIIYVIGNHELPHIYGMTLSKGDNEFTSQFEHRLGPYRPEVIQLFKSLPFMVRTAGGVLLTHAGASTTTCNPDTAEYLLTMSHDHLLAEAEKLTARDDIWDLLLQNFQMTRSEYDLSVWKFLAVASSDDSRYADLLRGFLVGNIREFQPLWDLLFTQCEAGISKSLYTQIVGRFVKSYSRPSVLQQVLVTGHIAAKNGYAIVTENQLRIASWAHSSPQISGKYLLFDVETSINKSDDLIPYLASIF